MSYQEAEEQIKMLMGVSIGHSTLHRLVNQEKLPLSQREEESSHGSIDGGKIRLRAEDGGEGTWKDYKAVSLGNGLCEAFFQNNQELQDWSTRQTLSEVLILLGDGHDGVWNLAKEFGGKQVRRRIEILDWFHLMENLHKVKMSTSLQKELRGLLWGGEVDKVIPVLKGIKLHQADCFIRYLQKHRHRLPSYQESQAEGLPIGSGDVESTVKRIGERIKITGASWKIENVPTILRLRTAFLNRSPLLSIST